MSTTTSRRGITKPSVGDPFVPHTDIGIVADAADQDVVYEQGVAASRPAGTDRPNGYVYADTDDGSVWLNVGTGGSRVYRRIPAGQLGAYVMASDGGSSALWELQHAGAGADLKRIRARNASGVTRFESLTDAGAPQKTAFDINHGTGQVDFPNGVTVENGLTVGGDAISGQAVGSFSAYLAGAQSVTTGATVVFDTEEWDVSSWYDTATGRFTPQRAGLYRVSARVASNVLITASHAWATSLAKNGSEARHLGREFEVSSGTAPRAGGTTLVQVNGSTDYLTVLVTHAEGSAVALAGTSVFTYFQAEYIGHA
jgi:hypothetical protein